MSPAVQQNSQSTSLFNAFPMLTKTPGMIQAQLHTTSLLVNELALGQPTGYSPGRASAPAPMLSMQQHKYLHASVQSIQAFFTSFAQWPVSDYIGSPFAAVTHVVRGLVTLWRLSTLDENGWDTDAVRAVADPLNIIDGLIATFERVPAVVGLDSSGTSDVDIYTQTARIFRVVRAEWAAILDARRSSAVDQANAAAAQGLNQNGGMAEMMFPEAFGMDIFEGDWLMGMQAGVVPGG